MTERDNRSHAHEGFHAHRHGVSSALFSALMITLVFMAVELVGGYVSNSLALISDAAHMLTDVGAMSLSIFVFWISKKPTTPTLSFSYPRVEILGALVSGLTIWLIAGFLVYEAVKRMLSPPEVKGVIVFVVASIGLAANLLSMKMLHSAKERSLNVRAAYLHLLADSLGSVGAVIAGVVLWLTGWRPIDPIITIIFAALMLVSSWELVKESVGILMESTPSGLDPAKIKKDLEDVEGVTEVHDLHVWTVASGRLALCVHLIAENGEVVLGRAHQVLQQRHGIVHTTIQVEHPDRFSSDRCYDCVPG